MWKSQRCPWVLTIWPKEANTSLCYRTENRDRAFSSLFKWWIPLAPNKNESRWSVLIWELFVSIISSLICIIWDCTTVSSVHRKTSTSLGMQKRFNPWVGKIPLEEETAIHTSILAWEIPWTEEPGGLQSMGSQRVRHDWAHKQKRRIWQWN